jgi:hypothetical protein
MNESARYRGNIGIKVPSCCHLEGCFCNCGLCDEPSTPVIFCRLLVSLLFLLLFMLFAGLFLALFLVFLSAFFADESLLLRLFANGWCAQSRCELIEDEYLGGDPLFSYFLRVWQ